MLVQYFKELELDEGDRIFVPLCGKTLDIGWLLSQGFKVVGAELSEIAIRQLFDELGQKPEVKDLENHRYYSIDGLEIFVGDIFELTPDILGSVNAVYDRAALVALPKELRKKYSAHLINITDKAPQLMICFEYDQEQMDGPPFSVSDKEVTEHYADLFKPYLLESSEVPGGLKGQCPAVEKAWLIMK